MSTLCVRVKVNVHGPGTAARLVINLKKLTHIGGTPDTSRKTSCRENALVDGLLGLKSQLLRSCQVQTAVGMVRSS